MTLFKRKLNKQDVSYQSHDIVVVRGTLSAIFSTFINAIRVSSFIGTAEIYSGFRLHYSAMSC